MRHLLPVMLSVLLLSAFARAEGEDTTYSLVVYGGVGYTRNFSAFDPEPSGLGQNGFVGTARFMWEPEHLLSLGLETGYCHVYSIDQKSVPTEFGTTDLEASQNAVPILLMASMKITDEWRITAGSGIYLLYTYTKTFATEVSPMVLSGGIAAAVTYLRPLSRQWSIGGEIKYYSMTKFSDTNLSIQFMAAFRIAEW
jgi:hypothetical protein